MTQQTYPFTLPPLPYAHDALEPFMDAETLHYHHGKHFANYIHGLNQALEPYPQLHRLTVEQLLTNPRRLPQQAQKAILQNGGGVYNHTLYFNGLAPQQEDCHTPTGELLALINRTYQSVERFKELFMQQALGVFGSGWTALVYFPKKKLHIVNLKDQDTLLTLRVLPLLYVDVWEHAYYLQYKNARADYLENLWNLIRFPVL